MSQNGRALISALNNGDYDALDRISLSETDIAIVNQRVHELFERAIGGENLPLFEALLQIPQVKVSGKDYCALRHAAQLGLAEYLQRLEGHRGVKPSLKDKSGFTALHLALIGRWPEGKGAPLVRILLGFPGIKVNARNLEKKTALHYAMDKEWYEVAELLMDAGANPNIEDAEGKTPTNVGLMAALPDSLFGKMLSFTGSGDDFDDEEPDENADPPLPDGTQSPEEVYKQMNSHKPEDMQIPTPQMDLTDPDRKMRFPSDRSAPAPGSDTPVYRSPNTNAPIRPISRNPNPDHHRAVDPLTTQIPSVNHNTPAPIKASPRDPQDPNARNPNVQDPNARNSNVQHPTLRDPNSQDPNSGDVPIYAQPKRHDPAGKDPGDWSDPNDEDDDQKDWAKSPNGKDSQSGAKDQSDWNQGNNRAREDEGANRNVASGYIKPHTPAPKTAREDTDDFHSIMGAENVEDLAGDLTRAFLLSRSEFDSRFKLHRAAVMERLEEINAVLKGKGKALRAEDFRVKDPTTGFNLWHVAAATGKFELALEVLASNGEWPHPEDLSERTEVGKSIPDVLDDMNRLSGVLHSDVWVQQPKLLAALLSQLPPHRQKQFTRLIVRTNLQILHG